MRRDSRRWGWAAAAGAAAACTLGEPWLAAALLLDPTTGEPLGGRQALDPATLASSADSARSPARRPEK